MLCEFVIYRRIPQNHCETENDQINPHVIHRLIADVRIIWDYSCNKQAHTPAPKMPDKEEDLGQ